MIGIRAAKDTNSAQKQWYKAVKLRHQALYYSLLVPIFIVCVDLNARFDISEITQLKRKIKQKTTKNRKNNISVNEFYDRVNNSEYIKMHYV